MRLIIVAGMHRSGTSFIAELLHTMGASLGEDLLEPAADNPYGFFERSDVKAINDAVLNRLGGSWDRPPAGLTRSWADSQGLDRLRKDAEGLLLALYDEAAGSDAYAIKDPRFSLTAPFWSSIIAPDVAIVPLRDPHLVAQSLRHRNGTSATRAASLWLRYVVDAVLELPDPHVVPLTEFILDPDGSVGRLADITGLEANLDRARHIARSRERLWQPAEEFALTLDDESMRLADAVYGVLTSGRPIAEIAPLLQGVAEMWRSTPLREIETATDRARVNDAVAARIADLHRRLEDVGLSLSDVRDQRDQAKRELRSSNQQAVAAEREADDRLRSAQSTLADEQARRADIEQQLTDERTRRADTEQQLTDEQARRADTEQQLTDERTRRAKAELVGSDHRALLREEHAKRTAAEQQQQALARRARAAERSFERLKSRRIVRFGLSLTRPLRPIVQVGRRVRRPRDGRPTPSKSADDADGTNGRPDPHPHRSWSGIVDRLTEAPDATIIIPVFNAPHEVERCLECVVAWTPRNVELIIIDDASTEPAVAPVLERFASHPNVTVLRNATNLGFTRTVNRGFESCSGDVLILNSDARVSPNWFVNLRAAAYSGDRIASASASSDNAGAFSLPERGRNELPGVDETTLARMHLQNSSRHWASSPTGHGFCMYFRRAALNEVGAFDADHFPRGYGEENDWSMRALGAGWEHIVDDSTMVFHSNAASFEPSAKAALVTRARNKVDELHPTYTGRVRAFMQETMEPVRNEARNIHAQARQLARHGTTTTVRPRILSVVQEGRGGTPETNRDLMGALERWFDPWILTSDSKRVRLHHVIGGIPQLVEELEVEQQLGSNRGTESGYREFVTRILLSMGFEVVHVRHLFKHAQDDIPDVLRATGIPAVLSLHDFYWVCPNVHLLDENGVYCGGHCTPGPGDCAHSMEGEPLPTPLKHHWVHQWRRSTRRRLDAFDQFVTTSESARSVLTGHYPELEAAGIHTIPHGRDLASYHSVAVEPDPLQIRLAVIGNLSRAKGGAFLRALLALDTDHLLDVHILGDVDPEFADLRCTFHGPYRREDLADLLAPIRPAFGALLSVWPETWSHTLTEAWSMGLPVLVSRLGGALCERVEQQGGGWVIDTDDPSGALDEIVALSTDLSRWRTATAHASVRHLPSLNDMAERYRAVYEAARARSTPDQTAVDLRVVTDHAGGSPGSAHVRALRRFEHPLVRRSVAASRSPRSVKSTPPDIIWVERTAVDPDELGALLHWRERHGLQLVVDIDDDLVHPDQLPRKFARLVPTMRLLLEAADLVTVSTPALVDAVEPWARRTVVLPNQLDESLWFPAGLHDVPHRKAADHTLDVLYMGTETHAGDLDLVREPFERFALEHLGGARLWVVGGAPRSSGEWFHRVPVPNEAKEYPRFVPWLRSLAYKWDFAIAPLEDTQFTRSKSDLKFLEYGALGLPTVVSNVEAYRHTVLHGRNGHVSENDHESWFRGLTVLSSRGYQDELRANHLQYVQTRTIAATAGQFVDLLRGLG